MTGPARLLQRVADQPSLQSAVRFLDRVRSGWRDDGAGGLAAEVAFFALLSVFPGLLAVAAAIGWLEGLFGDRLARRAEEQVLDVLETFLTANAQGTIDAVRGLFSAGSGGVFTLGVVVALWSASRGMAAVLRAVAQIYDTEDRRSWLQRRLLAVGLALGSMLVVSVMLAMLVLGPLLGAGRAVARLVGQEEVYGSVWNWVGLPVAFAVLMVWAVVILHAAPHAHRSWRPHLVAAAVTGVGWLLGSLGVRAYLVFFGGNPVFGVLGGALLVLLWLYVLSLALMAGAEVNAVLQSSEEDAGAIRAERRVTQLEVAGLPPVAAPSQTTGPGAGVSP